MDVDKKIRFSPGLAISLFIILIPSLAWMIGFDFADKDLIEIIGHIVKRTAAFAGMAMFAWSLILSGRFKFLDTWFRGLDKVYVAHRFFGTAALALLLFHPLGYTILHIADNGAGNLLQHFLGFSDLAVALGRVSLYGLILIGLWSIFFKVRHETFIAVHRWLGVLFVIGAVHAFSSGPESVLANNQFMWWYMFILSLTATLTFIHYSLLADFLHPYYKYKVSNVHVLPGGVIDIELEPKYRIPSFKPGQFFYVAFDAMDAEEYHPYSVASSNDSSKMRFLVKQLGDYTNKLADLKPGTKARLKGPYGGFTFNDKKHGKQLWIAGGIGVTPFLSKAHSLRFSKLAPEVKMFHCARADEEAIDKDILDIIEQGHRAFDYTCLPENEFGIISLKDIAEQIGELDDYAIYICGPPGMLKAYESQAQELGLDNQLYFEEFSF
ncbi:MAG: ferric reductase-like transmembrane domain-containing protein [Candidatus Saccharibacteria bacterium]|nr:ferric reductase-like transmembrane domain-containing protein [Candidatus Saccharibacteria bacterium]